MVKWGVEGVMFKILGRGNKKEENNLGSEKTKGIEKGRQKTIGEGRGWGGKGNKKDWGRKKKNWRGEKTKGLRWRETKTGVGVLEELRGGGRK